MEKVKVSKNNYESKNLEILIMFESLESFQTVLKETIKLKQYNS
jgi:hypothetical protein